MLLLVWMLLLRDMGVGDVAWVLWVLWVDKGRWLLLLLLSGLSLRKAGQLGLEKGILHR